MTPGTSSWSRRPPCCRPGSCAAYVATAALEEARAAGSDRGDGPNDAMMALLDDEGLTSVVATNCEQQYGRPLVVGDRVLVRSVIESISDPKRTALGDGHFVTTRMDYVAVPDADVPVGETLSPEQLQGLFDAGDPVATQRFRILKYLPPDRPSAPGAKRAASAPRHHPGQRLLLRRCACRPTADPALHLVRHAAPPAAAGLRHVRLARVGHRRVERPRHRVQLRGGALPAGGRVRLPAAHRPGRARGGHPARGEPRRRRTRRRFRSAWSVEVEFVDHDDELSLPVFVPVGAGAGGGA